MVHIPLLARVSGFHSISGGCLGFIPSTVVPWMGGSLRIPYQSIYMDMICIYLWLYNMDTFPYHIHFLPLKNHHM